MSDNHKLNGALTPHLKLPVTVLIMTQNEELNIENALESVADQFDQVIVADSFSHDLTPNICRRYPGVELYEHRFSGWADQRNWMLRNCAIRNDVVFFLDADEYVDADFCNELRAILESRVDFSSIYVRPCFYFLGSRLRFAYGHPSIRRIFRRNGLWFDGQGAREYAQLPGRSLRMQVRFFHVDRNPIGSWIVKHNSNADREAVARLNPRVEDNVALSQLPWRLRVTLFVRAYAWARLPSLLRPGLYFGYRYLLRLGFLDGWAGLIYCYLHAFWYQSLIEIKLMEARRLPSSRLRDS